MPSDPAPDFNLSQHFLIAMPGMEDELFARSVIYICEHTPRGVLGLCINKLADLSMHDLFRQAKLPMNRSDLEDEPIFWGGPVQSERGFILHPQAEDATTGLPVYASSLVTGDGLQMTTSRDILQALAEGHGPEKLLVALGYAAWESGQLEDALLRALTHRREVSARAVTTTLKRGTTIVYGIAMALAVAVILTFWFRLYGGTPVWRR